MEQHKLGPHKRSRGIKKINTMVLPKNLQDYLSRIKISISVGKYLLTIKTTSRRLLTLELIIHLKEPNMVSNTEPPSIKEKDFHLYHQINHNS